MVMFSTKNTENFYGSGGLSGQGPQLRLIKAFCGAALEPPAGHRKRKNGLGTSPAKEEN